MLRCSRAGGATAAFGGPAGAARAAAPCRISVATSEPPSRARRLAAGEKASIGIIGGADGPTAIFTASRLSPSLIGPIAISAYSYMAMVPLIQPPIMRLFTTRKERLVRMKPARASRSSRRSPFR